MRGKDGGYIASLSALDEAGVEGGSYLWSRERLASVLGERELEVALAMWEFPFGTQSPGLALPFARAGEESDPELAETVRLKLLAERARRITSAL